MSRKTTAVTGGQTGTKEQYNNLRDEAEASSRLLARAQDTPNMTLAVSEGAIYLGGVRIDYAGGNSPSFVAPVSNPRIDCLSMNSSGVLVVTQGVEGASPAEPACPAGNIPICLVYNKVGETHIDEVSDGTNGYILKDIRPFILFEVYVTASAGAGDIGKIPKLNASGQLDLSFLDQTNNLFKKPFVNQDLHLYTGTANPQEFCISSSLDGKTMIVLTDKYSTTCTLWRFYKDDLTGNYYLTHSTTLTVGSSGGLYATVIVGNYLYVTYTGGATSLKRYNIADLGSPTDCTWSGTAGASAPSAFSDGTYAYFQTGASASTFYKYSISGTVLTNVATITYTGLSGLTWPVANRTACDGTYMYYANGSNIYKWAVGGGALISTTPYVYTHSEIAPSTTFNIFMAGSGVIGFGIPITHSSATAVVGFSLVLSARPTT